MSQRYELISDLHLSQATPRTTAALVRHLEISKAEHLIVLGDWFDAWVGPEQSLEEPATEVARAVRKRVARGFSVSFMPGNRDFLLSESTLSDWHVALLPDPFRLVLGGTACLLSHGDALCLADADYQAFRRVARGDDWQRQFLDKPYAQRLALAARLRADSEIAKRSKSMATMDIDRSEALRWLAAADSQMLIHGHTHRPGSERLSETCTRHILSDWHLDGDDGQAGTLAPRAEVMQLASPKPGALSINRVSLV
jgi:UDP-2,3-diacylglucosamine hydrolase